VGFALVWVIGYKFAGTGFLVGGLVGIHHGVGEEDVSSIGALTVAC
jgi:hypothetical protein